MMQEILQLWFKSWRSMIEIILLSVGIYYGYLYFRGTRGAKVLTGLAIVFAVVLGALCVALYQAWIQPIQAIVALVILIVAAVGLTVFT